MPHILLLAATLGCARGQWLNYPEPRTPRDHSGQPNLNAPPPRRNGKPDLSGVWRAERPKPSDLVTTPGVDPFRLQIDRLDVATPAANLFAGTRLEDRPLTQEGRAVLAQRRDAAAFPPVHCLPAGVPAAMFVLAFRIVQTPELLVMLSETGDPPREIFTDGRGIPTDPDPTWMGSSVGKWKGDVLVVETTGFNEGSWLDNAGHPRSESMRITERYRRDSFGHMNLDITFDDRKYYTRPFAIKANLNLLPDTNILESVCAENEKDLIHMQVR